MSIGAATKEPIPATNVAEGAGAKFAQGMAQNSPRYCPEAE